MPCLSRNDLVNRLLQVLDREHIIADLEAQLAAAIRRAEPPLTMEQGVQVRTFS
jgi:hypothetical protein